MERKKKQIKDQKKTIKRANLWVDGFGQLTMGFAFEEDENDKGAEEGYWLITHLNEGYNYRILDWLLGETDCSLLSFKGMTITLRGECAIEDHQDGEVSFDDGKTWFNINKKKEELDKKYHEDHNLK